MSDDVVIGSSREQIRPLPGGVVGAADRVAPGQPSDTGERSAIQQAVENRQVERDAAQQTSATQSFLDPASAPASLQSVGLAAERQQESQNPTSLAQVQAQQNREEILGAPAQRADENRLSDQQQRTDQTDEFANQQAQQRSVTDEERLLNGSISAENRLIAQQAGSDDSIRVGEGAPSPAEQIFGTAAYREATLNLTGGAGNNTVNIPFSGSEGETQQQAANDTDISLTPLGQPANDDGTPQNSAQGFAPEAASAAAGTFTQSSDDASTPITAQRSQFSDFGDDQRQSALNAYEERQQLRTQNGFGITI